MLRTRPRTRIRFLRSVIFMAAIVPRLLGPTANAAATVAPASPSPAGRQVDFLKDIQPILTNSCYECHGSEKQKGGLRLDQKAAALKGGDSGPVLVPGKSAASLLIHSVTGTKADLERMHKKRDPLSDEQIG